MTSVLPWIGAAGFLLLLGGFVLIRRYRGTRLAPAPLKRPAADRALADSESSIERRHSPRRWGDPVQVLITDADQRTEPIRGWTLNRSAGGLGLSSPDAIPTGAVIKVRAALAPETVPWVDVEVRSCSALAGRWVLSCQFVAPPPDDARMLFR
jgi:hypothetical protein